QVVLRALAREPAERYQDAGQFKHDVQAALAATTRAEGRGVATHRPPVWLRVGFSIGTSGWLANGLARRDDDALILEFVEVDKTHWGHSHSPKEGKPQEVRIPLHEVASLAYGWGWGKPPCSLILKVTRLATLADLPGSNQGQVELGIRGDE